MVKWFRRPAKLTIRIRMPGKVIEKELWRGDTLVVHDEKDGTKIQARYVFKQDGTLEVTELMPRIDLDPKMRSWLDWQTWEKVL